MKVETSLWRAISALRVLALGYAVVLFLHGHDGYAHPGGAVVLLLAMAGWTAGVVTRAVRAPTRNGWPLLVADLAVASGAVLCSGFVQGHALVSAGAQTLPVVWPAAAVVAWSVRGGWRAGFAAAAVLSCAGVVERGSLPPPPLTVHNIVLLLLAGGVVGYGADLVRKSEQLLAHALAVEAGARERERLGRVVHDGVLQVLALVSRRGSELGGEGARLAALAGEQEAALRALVAARGTAPTAGSSDVDLRGLLTPLASATVTVSTPGVPVLCDALAATEVAAAVRAALDNVERHAGAGAHAWVLLEDEGAALVVSVRDDGNGFDPGVRLPLAAAQGRLGVASSVRGRLADLGGTSDIVSRPGRGTEIELRLPRTVSA